VLISRGGYIYIITNLGNTVLYTGVTNNLSRRILEHRNKRNPGSFSARYEIYKLVYYETFWHIGDAIAREKQIKAGSRQKKINLINSVNPNWHDLFDEITEQ
jgi:putative endonuclease